MQKYEFVLALMTVIFTGSTAITFITAWFSYREKKLKAEVRPADPRLEQRLERIETAIEAIALEVERVSEGQRFTTKLLTERQGVGAPLASGEPALTYGQREGGRHGA